jgi:hypothetical protein
MIRRLGYEATTKVEVFGQERRVEDTEWITWADSRGLVVFVKDDAIRRRPLERRALLQSSLRVFCLTNGNLRKDEQVARFEARWASIIHKCRSPGPYVCGIYSDRIEDLTVRPDRPDERLTLWGSDED